MADASESHMPDVKKKSSTSTLRSSSETYVAASSLSPHITVTLHEKKTDEANAQSLHLEDGTNSKQRSLYRPRAFVLSDEFDTSDDDRDISGSADSPSSASAGDIGRSSLQQSTPKVPWRHGGMWHLRSGSSNQRYEVPSNHPLQPKVTLQTDRRMDLHPEETDTDSENSAVAGMEQDYYNDDEDFEDLSEFQAIPSAWREWLELDMDSDNDTERPLGPPEEPLYPQSDLIRTECFVCFEEAELRRRLCCDFPVCDSCLESYLMVQVLRANVNIECLNINCTSYIQRSEVSNRLPPKYKIKFYKFLIDANIDPSVKTCPRCSSGLQVDKTTLKKRKVMKNGLPVTCQRCGLEWCFTCHAPLHKGLTCKEFRKGDILLKDWAREFHYGQMNAQQCPKCKIYIQRSLGCDHMTCSRCDTSFCYRCGENYRGIKLLGNHFSRYSPFGCRYNFLPESPHLRRLIRGAVLGGKVLGGLALSGFVVAAGACLLGVSVIALPAYGGYKLHQRRRYRQRLRSKKYFRHSLPVPTLQALKINEPTLPPLPHATLDFSDSMADDSSDEMRDRVVVGLKLPDSQRVEVLVHQTVSSSSDHEDSEPGTASREVVTDNAVIVTDVMEVTNQDGYTTVVTNVYAKSKDVADSTSLNQPSSSESDEEYFTDDGHSHSNLLKSDRRLSAEKRSSASSNHTGDKRKMGEGEGREHHGNTCSLPGAKLTDSDSDDQNHSESNCHKTEKESLLTLEKQNSEACEAKGKKDKASDSERTEKKQNDKSSTEKKEKEKSSESTEKSDTKTEKDKDSAGGHKPSDLKDPDETGKDSSNGCFGNIFSKKITVIQLGNKRNTDIPADGQKPTNLCFKSGTWEKSHSKSSNHKQKRSMDIRDLSHFKEKLPIRSDNSVKVSYEKGVLLQDFVVLSPPGDFSSPCVKDTDTLSLASAGSSIDVCSVPEPGKGGEWGSCCCLSASDSFRESNLSCDIVTYL